MAAGTGDLDAVVMRFNGGATVSYGYGIYIVRHGDVPAEGTEVVYADRVDVDELLVKWISPRVLEVSVAGGQVRHHQAVWEGSPTDSENRVHIRLKTAPRERPNPARDSTSPRMMRSSSSSTTTRGCLEQLVPVDRPGALAVRYFYDGMDEG